MGAQTLAVVDLVPFLISALAGLVIPSVVDFVTHSSAPWWVKSALATGLSALAGAISTTAWHGTHDWQVYLFNIFAAFVATFSSHQAGSSQIVQSVTGNFGLFKQTPVFESVPASSNGNKHEATVMPYSSSPQPHVVGPVVGPDGHGLLD